MKHLLLKAILKFCTNKKNFLTDISKNVASISVVSSVSNISSPITVNAETNTASSGIDSPTTALYVSPNDIVTLPKAMPRKKKSKPARRKGKTEIYTLTPVRNAVAEREQTQIQRKNSKKSSLKKKVKKFTAKKCSKRNLESNNK